MQYNAWSFLHTATFRATWTNTQGVNWLGFFLFSQLLGCCMEDCPALARGTARQALRNLKQAAPSVIDVCVCVFFMGYQGNWFKPCHLSTRRLAVYGVDSFVSPGRGSELTSSRIFVFVLVPSGVSPTSLLLEVSLGSCSI